MSRKGEKEVEELTSAAYCVTGEVCGTLTVVVVVVIVVRHDECVSG
jgi:hypothetical protein